jgi:hypothetical protein
MNKSMHFLATKHFNVPKKLLKRKRLVEKILRKGKAVFDATPMCKLRRKVEDKSGQKGWCKNSGLCLYAHEKRTVFAPASLTRFVFHFPSQLA